MYNIPPGHIILAIGQTVEFRRTLSQWIQKGLYSATLNNAMEAGNDTIILGKVSKSQVTNKINKSADCIGTLSNIKYYLRLWNQSKVQIGLVPYLILNII